MKTYIVYLVDERTIKIKAAGFTQDIDPYNPHHNRYYWFFKDMGAVSEVSRVQKWTPENIIASVPADKILCIVEEGYIG